MTVYALHAAVRTETGTALTALVPAGAACWIATISGQLVSPAPECLSRLTVLDKLRPSHVAMRDKTAQPGMAFIWNDFTH